MVPEEEDGGEGVFREDDRDGKSRETRDSDGEARRVDSGIWLYGNAL